MSESSARQAKAPSSRTENIGTKEEKEPTRLRWGRGVDWGAGVMGRFLPEVVPSVSTKIGVKLPILAIKSHRSTP